MSIKKKKYNLQRMNAQSVIAHCCLRSFGPIARGFVGWRYMYMTSAYIVYMFRFLFKFTVYILQFNLMHR